MDKDYYRVLEVAHDASQADIQKAYRELARKHHPDLNPEDKAAKQKFQEVQAAFDVLNDTKKRDLYDRYGSAFEQMGAGGGGGPSPQWSGGGAQGFEDFDFSELFGQRFDGSGRGGGPGGFADIFSQFRGAGSQTRPMRRRGTDIEHELQIPFGTSVIGGEAQISVRRHTGKVETITVKIPAGIEDGKKIRLRGQGEEGAGGATAGDILIAIRVAPHPCFQRSGKNLTVKVPVTIGEAGAGAKVDVPTPHGTVTLSIPPSTSGGTRLRVKGQGVKAGNQTPGDLIVEIQIVLPEKLEDQSKEWFAAFDEQHPMNPRGDLRW